MQQLGTEYPTVDFQHTAIDRIEPMMIPLFAANLFQPVFGTPYERLSDADMLSIARDKLHPCSASPYRSQMILSTVTDYAFNTRLTLHAISPVRLVPALAALAQARRSLAAVEASVPALPGTPETFEKLKVIGRDNAADLKLVLPSERTAFNKVIGEAVARSAQPTLDAKMSALMAGATTYDGLQALRQAPQTQAELFAAVSPDYRAQLQRQIDTRYNQGIQQMLVAQRTESQHFSGDQKGLEGGAVWYRSFQIRFLRSSPSPEAQAISSEFLKKRETQLAKFVPDLRRQIHQAKSEEAMNAVISSIFLLPEDRQSPSYDQLKKYVGEQATASLQQPADTPPPPTTTAKRSARPARPTSSTVGGEASGGEGSLQIGTTYINPAIVDNIYTGHLDAVPFGEPYTKLYLYNMVDNIAETCEAYFTKAQLEKLSMDAVLKAQDMSEAGGAALLMGALQNLGQIMRNPQGIQRAAQSAKDQDELPMNAMKDSFVLMKRHYCGTPELERFNKSAVAFIENQGAPLRGVDEISLQCQREHTDVVPKQSSNDCNCFTSAMTQSAISRAERKTLADNVWENAQKIMRAHPNDFTFCRK